MKRFKTISEFLQFRQLPKPDHPLIAVFKVENVASLQLSEPASWCYDFYCIGLKRVANANEVKLKYGQQLFDHDEGILSFVAPNQVLALSVDKNTVQLKQSGWMLLIHPDFLWNTPLAITIKHYDFWHYAVNEALFLSEKEETVLVDIIRNIQQECQSTIDTFSKHIITSQIETLLRYSERFYNRQFITREKSAHQVLSRFETLLDAYFSNAGLNKEGLLTVQHIAAQLHLSPKYLSSLLKTLTGQNAQQHIHEKLIEKAKERLSTTSLTVSEIAYGLGFEHLQSFSKLFKAKTSFSPLEFRQTFN
ncbi:helix-turn-helix domain-containing protein [Spirosoma pollinicola]|uniref:AraC family transcriptional regulator n=1 Tax=Spirosoma pollinicola TaxID=2057025 RepID=A0A2K8Z9T0_9BACT|nr:helix-turn-helix transcriptional regulator [Spirosoma pollinicola]AUD06599.1 AraC family transcriptional regulator [Spirosoma pollinicola]